MILTSFKVQTASGSEYVIMGEVHLTPSPKEMWFLTKLGGGIIWRKELPIVCFGREVHGKVETLFIHEFGEALRNMMQKGKQHIMKAKLQVFYTNIGYYKNALDNLSYLCYPDHWE